MKTYSQAAVCHPKCYLVSDLRGFWPHTQGLICTTWWWMSWVVLFFWIRDTHDFKVKSFFTLCLNASSILWIISSWDCHSVACWPILLLPGYYCLNGCSLGISFVTLLCLIPCLLISLSLCFLLPRVIGVSLLLVSWEENCWRYVFEILNVLQYFYSAFLLGKLDFIKIKF